MRKTLVAMLVAMMMISCASGMAYAHIRAMKAHEAKLVEVTLHETIHDGDRLDNILEQYYNADNEGICWDDFRAIHYKLNAKVLRDGFRPGEQVVIVCKVLQQ